MADHAIYEKSNWIVSYAFFVVVNQLLHEALKIQVHIALLSQRQHGSTLAHCYGSGIIFHFWHLDVFLSCFIDALIVFNLFKVD